MQKIRSKMLVAGSLACAFSVAALAQPDTAWVRRYGGPAPTNIDWIRAATMDADGNVIMTGYSSRHDLLPQEFDMATVKYDPAGNRLWDARFPDVSGQHGTGKAVVTDDEGNVYVAGMFDDLVHETGGLVLAKYNPAGQVQWTALRSGNSMDEAADVALDSDGNVFVAGSVWGVSSRDFCVAKYDAAGTEQWVAVYDGGGLDGIAAMGVDPAGNVYVTGTCSDPVTYDDIVTVKYSPSGDELWVAVYDGPIGYPDEAKDIAVDALGNVYVTGMCSVSHPSNDDCVTIKYDTDGNEQWINRYDGPAHGSDRGFAMALDAAGNIYVTGQSWRDTKTDIATVKYNSAGFQQWAAVYSGAEDWRDWGRDVAVDALGNVYVTGVSVESGDDGDICVLKYSPTGQLLWSAHYDGTESEDDEGWAVLPGTLGEVYVAGEVRDGEEGHEHQRYCLIKYVEPVPDVWVAPAALDQAQVPDVSNPVHLWVGNAGDAALGWSLSESPAASWLAEAPASGSVPPGDSVSVSVTFNSAGLAPGTYRTTLRLTSNCPANPTVDIPVELEVLAPAEPHVVIDAVAPLGLGQAVVIQGRTVRNDGTPYVPGVGELTVDDPVQQTTVALMTNGSGEFSHSAVLPDTARLLAFVFRLTYTDAEDVVTLFVPTLTAGTGMELPLASLADVGMMDAASSRTTVLARFDAGTHVPIERNGYFNAALVQGRDLSSLLATNWDEYCGGSPTVNLLWAPAVSFDEEHMPGNFFPDSDIGSVTAVLDSGKGAVLTDFRAVAERIIDVANPTDKQAYKDLVNSPGSALTGFAAVQGVGPVDISAAAAQLATVDTAAVYDVQTDGGSLKSFRFTGYGGSGCVLAGSAGPLSDSMLKIRVTCPVDLVVTDRLGRVVSKYAAGIPGASYLEADLNGDGDPDDEITIPDPVDGSYSISVLRERGAMPNDSFTLIVDWPGQEGVLVLAEGMQLRGANDYGFSYGRGDPGWSEMASLPEQPSGRAVKRGGWLASLGAYIYAGKGYKTQDFYRYDLSTNAWTELGPLPYGDKGGRQREAKKGSRGVSDGGNHIYYTAGNNTLTFYKYQVDADQWTQLPDVPEGPNRKRVKGGNDMAYVVLDDTGWVYLMKGYKTEFYRFNTVTGVWDTLPDVPAYREKMKYGSWLAYDGDNKLYTHEANYYNRGADEHYMYAFDIATSTWASEPLPGMPLYGLHGGRVRKKKSKDGGSGAYCDGALYALKGGNSQQFWQYDLAANVWTELDTVPTNGSTGRKRRAKHGAYIVASGDGVFHALKGNKTLEFWRYVTWPSFKVTGRMGVMANPAGERVRALGLAPNPVNGGRTILRYVLPKAGPAAVGIYDVAGRCLRRQDYVLARHGSVPMDVRELPAGVYLVRLDTDDYTATRKLVIQH